MTYLIGQILICLLIAALIGLVIGWLLGSFMGGSSASAVEADRDAARSDLNHARSDLTAANSRVKTAEDALTAGEARAKAAESARETASAATTDAEAKVEAMRTERDIKQQRLDEGDTALKACRERRDVLTAELAAASAVPPATEPVADAKDESASLKKLRKELKQAKLTITGLKSARPTFLLDGRPEEPDDLKVVKGIGPVFEGLLNSLGVYFYSQVGQFTETDTAWVASRIDTFPDRIDRDEWVTQAKALAAAKEQ